MGRRLPSNNKPVLCGACCGCSAVHIKPNVSLPLDSNRLSRKPKHGRKSPWLSVEQTSQSVSRALESSHKPAYNNYLPLAMSSLPSTAVAMRPHITSFEKLFDK
jgi:hypothetical protein